MSKRRMVGWQPLAVQNTNAPTVVPASDETTAAPQPAPTVAPQPQASQSVPVVTEHSFAASSQAAPAAVWPFQDANVSRRRLGGWQPLAVVNPATPVTQGPAESRTAPLAEPISPTTRTTEQPAAPAQSASPAGPMQDPDVPRRRMAGWQPLTEAHHANVTAASEAPAATAATQIPAPTTEYATPATTQTASSAPAPVTEDLPRRRMGGWEPLKVGHPTTATPAVEQSPAPVPEPTPAADTAPAAPPRRMGTSAAAPQTTSRTQSEARNPDVVMPESSQPAATQPAAAPKPAETKKEPSKVRKVVLTLLGVAVVAAGLVLLAQRIRTMGPVADFIATYDGTPTHPDGVVAGIPGWVGWQHFFNFFIIVMVVRSGLFIRYQERPEAYWTPTEAGFFSPGKKNTPQKVTIQQWVHQSFNVLWVVNGLVFYILVFVTGHWMRIVPTNWDIFPNILSAGIQYMSLDWPAENSWIYYNALQIMTYFITVFIAAPIAVLTGLRLSTWWPQKADRINKTFSLPVARKIHFVTMVYFVLFIIVHLFLVVTTGILTNLNMMFTARDASDWWGVGVFAFSVAITVGVAWLIKPIFISGIAERTGQVSTR